MKYLVHSAIIFILILSVKNSYSATGCVSQSSGYLYFNLRSTVQQPGVPNYTWRNSADRSPNNMPSSTYCLTNRQANNTCYIVNDTGTSTGAFYGYLVDYGPLPCPLDDYIPWTILPIGLFSFFIIRKKQLLLFT